MNPASWTCAETALKMESYRTERLSDEDAEDLFDHLLRCTHCFEHHWQLMREEQELLTDFFLDVLEGPGGQEPTATTLSGETLGELGEWTTLSEWTSPSAPGLESAPDGRASSAWTVVGAPGPDETPVLQGPHLRQVGTLLPHVPRPDLLRGYQLYLGESIPSLTETPGSRIRLTVTRERKHEEITVTALKGGVFCDGLALPLNEVHPLRWSHLLEHGANIWRIVVAGSQDKTLPGAGLIGYAGPHWGLEAESVRLGRSPDATIGLPDRSERTNLLLRAGPSARSFSEESSRELARLRLDRVAVSRLHAQLTRAPDGSFCLTGMGEYPVYLQADDGTWKGLEPDATSSRLLRGTRFIVGQSVFACVEGGEASGAGG